jgi:hypothetical protein
MYPSLSIYIDLVVTTPLMENESITISDGAYKSVRDGYVRITFSIISYFIRNTQKINYLNSGIEKMA